MIRLKFVCIQYWDGDSVPCVKRSISSQSINIRSTISAAHWSRSWTRRQWQNEAIPIMISPSFRIMPTHSTMRRTPLPMLFDKAVKFKKTSVTLSPCFSCSTASAQMSKHSVLHSGTSFRSGGWYNHEKAWKSPGEISKSNYDWFLTPYLSKRQL